MNTSSLEKSIRFITDIWTTLNVSLFSIAGAEISLASFIILAGMLFVFSRVSKWAEKLVHATLAGKDLDMGVKGSMERIAGYFVFCIGVLITLKTLGLNLDSITTFGGVLLVGLGFGLQNITQNFVSGLIILFERPIKKGDIVEVGGRSGRVLDIKFRSTLILTRDDVIIIVPNSQFISEQVVNESFSGHKIRLKIALGVSYGSDTENVSKILLDVAKSHPKVLDTPPPTVVFESFGESALNFKLQVWTTELWFQELMLSELRFKIDKAFKEHNISIPFPQLDLHIKSQIQKISNLDLDKK